jgi:hypothetical protein
MHEQILRPKQDCFSIHFVEDAASLQHAIMQVLRLIHSPNADYKACGLSLYALQIACMNLKNFTEEQVALAVPPEVPEERPVVAEEKKPPQKAAPKGDEPSLAEFLLGMLAKGPGGDPDAPPPRIRNREDYYAVTEQKRPPNPATLPGESAAG